MDGPPTARATPRMCVLASGSTGNCTVLVVDDGHRRRVMLIDCGLSPRRTRRMLMELGVDPAELTDIFITHLDHDHVHGGWNAALPDGARVHMHRRHMARAVQEGFLLDRVVGFDDELEVGGGMRAAPTLLAHDWLGVVAFRFEFEGAGTLGFATDVGRTTPRLIEHMRGVDVLAIESNYCPKMQIASDRPEFLKSRVMGGAGHLSNAQCAQAVRAIGPGRHVVLLHLSQDCNRRELAAEGHLGAGYGLTISSADEPTSWIELSGTPRNRMAARVPTPDKSRTIATRYFQPALFA